MCAPLCLTSLVHHVCSFDLSVLLDVAMVSFLFLYSIPLHELATNLFIQYTVVVHLSCFHFFAIKNNVIMNILVNIFW